jgi:hypothetical protein
LVFISSWKEYIFANIHSIICSIFVVWRYKEQDPVQCPFQPLLTPVVVLEWL